MQRVSEYKNIYYTDKNYVPPANEQYDPNVITIYGAGYYVTYDVEDEDGIGVTDIYGPFATLVEAVDHNEKLLTNS